MTVSSPHGAPRPLLSSEGRGWNALAAELVHIPRGLSRAPGGKSHGLGIHFGPPVRADCMIGGVRMRGLQKAGDIGFIPAGADGSWEDDADCRILRLSLHPLLLAQVAEQLGHNAARLEFVPRLQMRDAGIEAIGRAIKADLEATAPSDPLYIDLLTNALAVRLIETSSNVRALPEEAPGGRMAPGELKRLTDFIEANLDRKLNLAELATVAGVSATRLKILFRNSIGMPVHQYVVRRRVEYARALISTTSMPASQIALAAGFAHQSHMATTMRRLLGRTPGKIARPSTAAGPILQRPTRI